MHNTPALWRRREHPWVSHLKQEVEDVLWLKIPTMKGHGPTCGSWVDSLCSVSEALLPTCWLTGLPGCRAPHSQRPYSLQVWVRLMPGAQSPPFLQERLLDMDSRSPSAASFAGASTPRQCFPSFIQQTARLPAVQRPHPQAAHSQDKASQEAFTGSRGWGGGTERALEARSLLGGGGQTCRRHPAEGKEAGSPGRGAGEQGSGLGGGLPAAPHLQHIPFNNPHTHGGQGPLGCT